jgi:hypothetical protein
MTEDELIERLTAPRVLLNVAAGLSDLRALALLQAKFSAAEYFRTRPDWDGLVHFGNAAELMLYAMGAHTLPDGRKMPRLADKRQGVALEFGVATGQTINRIARTLEGWAVYGFDSFEGLPEAWERHPAGAYAQKRLPDVPANVTLIKGWFSDTLPDFVAGNEPALHERGIDLLHLDADLYSSTKCALDHIGQYLNPGCVVVFDEYIGYPNWEQHERKAWEEFVAASGVTFKFTAVCLREGQASAIVLENPSRP